MWGMFKFSRGRFCLRGLGLIDTVTEEDRDGGSDDDEHTEPHVNV